MFLASPAGIEPATLRLKISRSASELRALGERGGIRTRDPGIKSPLHNQTVLPALKLGLRFEKAALDGATLRLRKMHVHFRKRYTTLVVRSFGTESSNHGRDPDLRIEVQIVSLERAKERLCVGGVWING